MNSYFFLFASKLDVQVLSIIPHYRNDLLTNISIFINILGNPTVFGLLIIATCLFFWLSKKPYYLMQFLVTTIIGALTVYLVKIYVARPRPIEAIIATSGYSFPSGHTVISTIICCLIIYSYKEHLRNVYIKFVFMIIMVVLSLFVSFSRVYLAVHNLSDVVVGILVGLLISSISIFIFENFYKKHNLL